MFLLWKVDGRRCCSCKRIYILLHAHSKIGLCLKIYVFYKLMWENIYEHISHTHNTIVAHVKRCRSNTTESWGTKEKEDYSL